MRGKLGDAHMFGRGGITAAVRSISLTGLISGHGQVGLRRAWNISSH